MMMMMMITHYQRRGENANINNIAKNAENIPSSNLNTMGMPVIHEN
jgi:hypothetical protein